MKGGEFWGVGGSGPREDSRLEKGRKNLAVLSTHSLVAWATVHHGT